ncbi:hypothetical protein [Paraburkholderia kururiensis]|uniref:Lipoprotein n=1 Tax=Paraburkholderia kururiensis TaxID=984307 RepID=A0ABZ0WFD2_9BURK|nr:hypothetical protein [Paraburkholderia kururiensis]WQD76062.1 hypothetical protein U0042_18300 [Paraburkholderia kururiensis]
MKLAQWFLCFCFILTSAACSHMPQNFQLAAAPLAEAPDTPASAAFVSGASASAGAALPASHVAGTAGGLTKFQVVNLLVQDSQRKCSDFVDSLFAQTAGSGFLLDTLSTVSSALATVFTPTSVTHAFSAGSTVFSATKASMSADYLNALSISHIAQSIQATYQTDIRTYLKYLDSLDTTARDNIDVFNERTRILSYHQECSLAWAEGTISSSLQSGASQGGGQASGQISVSYTVPDGASVDDIAKAIANKISQDPTVKQVGMSADPDSGGVIKFTMKKAFRLNASVNPAAHQGEATMNNDSSPVTLTISGPPAPGDIITVSGTPPSQITPSGSSQQPVQKPGAAVLRAVRNRVVE